MREEVGTASRGARHSYPLPALLSYFFDCRGLADEVNGVAPWAVDVLLGLVVRF